MLKLLLVGSRNTGEFSVSFFSHVVQSICRSNTWVQSKNILSSTELIFHLILNTYGAFKWARGKSSSERPADVIRCCSHQQTHTRLWKIFLILHLICCRLNCWWLARGWLLPWLLLFYSAACECQLQTIAAILKLFFCDIFLFRFELTHNLTHWMDLEVRLLC